MAFERGLLTGPDLNEVQERILVTTLLQNRIDEGKKQESQLEQQLMIHRPDVWQKIQEEKEEVEAMGFDDIVWKTPESIDEFREIEKAFSDISNNPNTVTEEVNMTNPLLQGLNLEELGEDG
jgi:hypothetical protein